MKRNCRPVLISIALAMLFSIGAGSALARERSRPSYGERLADRREARAFFFEDTDRRLRQWMLYRLADRRHRRIVLLSPDPTYFGSPFERGRRDRRTREQYRSRFSPTRRSSTEP